MNFNHRIVRQIELLLFLLSGVFMISACKNRGVYKDIEGVTFIAPIGSPVADSIVWAPFDDRLLVTALEPLANGPSEIYLINVAKSKKEEIVRLGRGMIFADSWAPDGKEILLIANEGAEGFEQRGLWKMNLGNKTAEFIKDSSSAAWSPNGKYIATIDRSSNGIDISLREINSGAEEKIFSKPAVFGNGISFSPDGEKLIFTLQESSSFDQDIYVGTIATKDTVKITDGGSSSQFSWSTDDIIAFIQRSQDGIDSILQLMSTDGKCIYQIQDIKEASSPTWSPEGKRLAFIGPDGIYVLDIEEMLGIEFKEKFCK